jgi:aryl-alcohol dehydrogenase-like predicted oxidoreductase
MSGIQTIFGGAQFQREGRFADPATLLKVYDALEKGGVRKIDTAHIYGASEEILGQTGGSKRFEIDTKAPGGLIPGSITTQGVQGFAHRSKKLLDVEQVDVYYIHAPDVVPLEEMLAGVNEIYKEGWFKRFGLSNFFARDVQKIYDICKREGYPLPTVYQGDYSAIARKQEEELLPLLRKLDIVSLHNIPLINQLAFQPYSQTIQHTDLKIKSFYAYSPLAGGFLTKSVADITARTGRFAPGQPFGEAYNKRFNKPCFLEALEKWAAVAEREGTTKADLAYRWVKYNSPLKPEYGDGIIVGATSLEQLEQTLAGIGKGPVSEEAAKAIEEIWEGVKSEAVLDLINQ